MRFAAALAALALCAQSTPAQTDRFNGPGFTFRYPSGWMVASPELQRTAVDAIGKSVNWLPMLDLDQVEACVFSPEDDGFSENLNLVVLDGSISDDVIDSGRYVNQLEGMLSSMGAVVEDTETGTVEVDGKKAASILYSMSVPGVDADVRAWQVAVPGKRRTYVFTMTAGADDFDRLQPTFRRIVRSIEVDSGLVGFWLGLPDWTRHGIVGGLIGGLVMVAFGLLKLLPPGRGRLAVRRTTRFDPRTEGTLLLR